MKKSFKLLITMLFSIFIIQIGCAPGVTLTANGNKVEIINETRTNDLEFIGYVQGTSVLTGMLRQRGYDNAVNELLNKAAEMGARYVVLDNGSAPKYWTTEQVVRGKAYKNK